MLLALVGCSTTPGEWAEAESKCNGNGGVEKLTARVTTNVVTCNNGASFITDAVTKD